jgi:hypothetical protein
MVDRVDLELINNLYRELSQLGQAVSNLDNGGQIASMVIMGNGPDVPSAIVRTVGWPYPQQMVTSILHIINQRQRDIADELVRLGLTGVEPPAER